MKITPNLLQWTVYSVIKLILFILLDITIKSMFYSLFNLSGRKVPEGH